LSGVIGNLSAGGMELEEKSLNIWFSNLLIMRNSNIYNAIVSHFFVRIKLNVREEREL
jgi:hypothetical protein